MGASKGSLSAYFRIGVLFVYVSRFKNIRPFATFLQIRPLLARGAAVAGSRVFCGLDSLGGTASDTRKKRRLFFVIFTGENLVCVSRRQLNFSSGVREHAALCEGESLGTPVMSRARM